MIKKVKKKNFYLIIISLLVLSVVLSIISIFLPWYEEVQDEYWYGGKDETNVRKYEASFFKSEFEVTYWDGDSWNKEYGHGEMSTFIITLIIYAVGICLSITSIVLLLISYNKVRLFKSTIIIVVLGFVFLLSAPIFFGIVIPHDEPDRCGCGSPIETYYHSTFFGSNDVKYDNGDEVHEEWGPGLGWYFALISSILILIVGILYFLRHFKKK